MSKWIPVLVIDDDELVRINLKRTMQLYGFKAYLAKDGPTGLKLAQEKIPAFILLDWRMPEMDGLEVLSELKHNKKTKDIPVFMLTVKGMIGDLDQAFEIGADDYIMKPLDMMEFGRIIKAKWQKYINGTDAHTQHLCYIVSQGFHLSDEAEYQALAKEPQFKCKQCGRVAKSENNLCKPVKL